MPYSKEDAEAIAAKREANKSKHMTNKTWKAVEEEDGTFSVKLVDSEAAIRRAKNEETAMIREAHRIGFAAAILMGDRELMREIARESLLLKVETQLEELDRFLLPGETRDEGLRRMVKGLKETDQN